MRPAVVPIEEAEWHEPPKAIGFTDTQKLRRNRRIAFNKEIAHQATNPSSVFKEIILRLYEYTRLRN
jgi:hypothetical protein